MSIPQTRPSAPTSTEPNRATRRAIARRKNLTTQEAADYLNVSVRTIHYWLRQGIVQGHRCGPRLLRFDADELDEAVSHL